MASTRYLASGLVPKYLVSCHMQNWTVLVLNLYKHGFYTQLHFSKIKSGCVGVNNK